jgi:sugar/nucleoside kinase (ribokinase family)
MAKAVGVLISYDPNYRPSLWKSKEYAVKKMKSVVELVDVMKVSDEESILLTGAKSYEQAAEEILAMGPKAGCHYIGRTWRSYGNKKQKRNHQSISDTCSRHDRSGGFFLGRRIMQYSFYK